MNARKMKDDFVTQGQEGKVRMSGKGRGWEQGNRGDKGGAFCRTKTSGIRKGEGGGGEGKGRKEGEARKALHS